MDETAFNYDDEATLWMMVVGEAQADGCTDNSFIEFNSLANVDDGSCLTVIYGCTTVWFVEYDANANVDDGSCENVAVYGCRFTLCLCQYVCKCR